MGRGTDLACRHVVFREPGPERRLLVAGLALFSIGSIVTAWTGVYVGAVIGFALLGLAKPMIDISSQVYVSERVAYEERARYLGILEIAWAGGLLLGAPLAGWLIENWSWEAPLGRVARGSSASDWRCSSWTGETTSRMSWPRTAWSSGALVLVTVALFGFSHESLLVVLGAWLEGSFGLSLIALGGAGSSGSPSWPARCRWPPSPIASASETPLPLGWQWAGWRSWCSRRCPSSCSRRWLSSSSWVSPSNSGSSRPSR